MNDLELDVLLRLDGAANVRWWHRLVARQDYYIVGWRPHRIYPDFLGTIADAEQRLALLETKGNHLKGNEDSVYKQRVLELLASSYDTDETCAAPPRMVAGVIAEDTWRADLAALLGVEG